MLFLKQERLPRETLCSRSFAILAEAPDLALSIFWAHLPEPGLHIAAPHERPTVALPPGWRLLRSPPLPRL